MVDIGGAVKFKTNLAKIKAVLKAHAPEIILGATSIIGVVGWVVAEVYARRVEELETVDPDAWPTIEVTPGNMKDVRAGATLMYREAKFGDRSYYSQSTTLGDGFPPEANEKFEEFKKTGKTK